jgi:hypothetical protein
MTKTASFSRASRLQPSPSGEAVPAIARPLKAFAGGPKAVGSFVPKLAQKAFEKFGFATAAVLTDWTSIVGPEIAAYTAPERLRWPRPAEAGDDSANKVRSRALTSAKTGATLMLRVEPARALDVQYRTAQIIERINAYFGYLAVTEIRLTQAPLARPTAAPIRRQTLAPRAVIGKSLGQVEAAGIEDSGLRLALERLGSAIGAAPHRHG